MPVLEPDIGILLSRVETLERRILELEELTPARCFEVRNVAPDKPREGMVALADGTDWNPGSGQGVYAYYGGAWVKL